MRKEARHEDTLIARWLEAVGGSWGLPGTGLISAIGHGVSAPIRARRRKAAEEAADRERAAGYERGIDQSRSYPMDVGLTGGMTLLLDRSDPRRRRR